MIKAIPYRYRVLVLLCSLTTLTYLDRICISIVGVRIKTEFTLSNEQFGWVLASFALAYALFEIPSGLLGDHIGPRKVFIRIVLWWSLFTAVTGITTGLISLMFVRFLFGIGESGTYPNALITVSRWFPANETGRSLTWVGIGSQIGSAIAPLLIIPLAASYGWRMPFYVNAAIGGIWVLCCYSWFKDFPAQMRNISAKEREHIEANCRHSIEQRRIPLKAIFKNRTVWALMCMYFCFQWSNYFFVAWMPVYLQEGRHFTEQQTSPIIFTLFIAGIIGLLSGGFFGDWIVKKKGLRFGRRFVGFTGMGACALMIFLAALFTENKLSAACLIAANFSYSFAVMTSYAVCADIGRSNTGSVTGAMNFFGQMGAFFLALMFGKIADLMHNFNYPLFIVSFVTLTGCMLWLVIDPTKQVAVKTAADE
ncbi:MAG TPA: MFS transporter [Panacibacter sp.]|nr:MFS transporter [Panacibacter sp.]